MFCLNSFFSGRKGGTVTIESDQEYMIAVDALLKKNKATCQIGVEFDVDGMEGFRIHHKHVHFYIPNLTNSFYSHFLKWKQVMLTLSCYMRPK